MSLSWFEFLLLSLAIFRMSRLLVLEDGPFDISLRIRKATGFVYDDLGNLVSYPSWNFFHCIWCCSIWFAPLGIITWSFGFVGQFIIVILALSSVAGLLSEVKNG